MTDVIETLARALRENDQSSFAASRMIWWIGLRDNGGKLTPLGLTVLAELDKEKTP